MSRTNPYKKKRRSANRTLLIYGEGLNEEIILKYLRGIYSYNKNVAITIKRGKGGTAYGLVIETDKTQGAFDARVAVLDNDKRPSEMQKAREEANSRNIKLVEHTPCLESVLLSIICIGQGFKEKSSAWCKEEFESKYLDKRERTEFNELVKLFPKSLLEARRTKISELEKLLSIMEGKI